MDNVAVQQFPRYGACVGQHDRSRGDMAFAARCKQRSIPYKATTQALPLLHGPTLSKSKLPKPNMEDSTYNMLCGAKPRASILRRVKGRQEQVAQAAGVHVAGLFPSIEEARIVASAQLLKEKEAQGHWSAGAFLVFSEPLPASKVRPTCLWSSG